MKRLKRAGVVLLVMLMIFSMAGCKKKTEAPKEETKKEKTEESKKTEPVETKEPEEAPANQNLLTGLGDLTDGAIGKRPVAVMVNNVQDALPQYGTGKADIIYEIPVEGDVTRLMAVYGDYISRRFQKLMTHSM